MMKITAQTPERVQWEESVLGAIEAQGICRSDAQAVIETDEELLDSLFLAGAEPVAAAKQFLN